MGSSSVGQIGKILTVALTLALRDASRILKNTDALMGAYEGLKRV